MSLKRSPISLAAMLALGGLAAGVQAQDQSQRIEITGSHIKRTAAEISSPIDRLTAADIAATGAKTVLELMRTVPALGFDGFNDTPTQNGFSRGVATASLRSLSSTSTLILLNGRRLTPAAYANPNNGTSTLYDLNQIPISALERVEVFKDGASAVYGSDAVGGVINFITKRNYEGIEVGARAAFNDDQEFGKRTVTATAGFGNYDKDGYNFLISADLTKRDATSIYDGSNDIHAADYAAINLRLNPFSSSFSALPFFTKERAPGTRSFPQTGSSARVVNVTAGCDPSQLITGSDVHGITSSINAHLLGRTFCNFNNNDYADLQTKGDDTSIIGRGTLRLGKDTSGFVEFGLSESKRYYRGSPRAISGLSPTNNFLLGGLAPTFQAILEVGHPDNPFNNDPTPGRAAVGIRFVNFTGNTELVNEQKRLLAGLQGSLGSWEWETAVLWNQTDRKETQYGFLRLPVLTQMLGAPGPTSGRTLASIAADPNLSKPITDRGEASILQYDAKVTTEFGKLPGGPIGMAAGIELRRESIEISPDAANAKGEILGLATTAVKGDRDVKSAYIEFRAPVLKNLEFDLAGRWDKYPGLKTSFVPKVGGKWSAGDFLVVRSTYSEGFRAPAVSQVSPGGAQFFVNNLHDPLRCEEDGQTPKPGAAQSDCAKSVSGVGGQNPNLKPEDSKAWTFGLILSPVRGLDISVDYYKIRKIGEVALGSAQDVIDHPDRYPPGSLVRDTNPALLLNGVAGTGPLLSVSQPWVNQGSTEVQGIDFDIKGTMPLAGGRFTGSLRGTYTLRYSRQEDLAYPENNLVGTNGGLADWATSVGDVPRLKLRFAASYEFGAHQFTAAINHVSSISFLRQSDGSTEPPVVFSGTTCHWGGPNNDGSLLVGRTVLGAAPTATNGRDLYINRFPNCGTGDWETVDVGYTYRGIKNLTLGLHIANLFDKKAPYYPGSNTSATVQQGHNSALHNNLGRYYTLSVNYKFR